MFDNCDFSLWSPGGGGFVEDRAFSCYAQAMSGDFTVGQNKLNEFCQILADNYNKGYWSIDTINDISTHKMVAEQLGFNFDNLLDEEVDYCIQRLEGLIMYG